MRAAVIQFAAVPFALEANRATAERLVRQAAGQGAQLISLPAFFNTGYAYSPRLTAAAEPPAGPTARWLTALSAELGVHLAGALLSRVGGQVVNALTLVSPDGRAQTYAQRHPFLWEGCYFAPGRASVVAETALGRLGLLSGWDVAHPSAWAAYAGRVDTIVLASAPPRLHRALYNFPAARKVYLAELLPMLLKRRRALDELYGRYVGACAAALGVPVLHAALAGRFVAALPYPRLSFFANAATQPQYWSWTKDAPQATVRATFYGTSALYAADGAPLAAAPADALEAVVLADLPLGQAAPAPRAVPPPPVPWQLRLFERVLRPLAHRAYARHRAAPAA